MSSDVLPDHSTVMPPDAATIPEGLPPQFWDSQGGKVNMPELVKSYGEVAAFKTQHDERLKALPRTPDDYKIEVKLPDGIALPEGMRAIDDSDPRVPAVRAFAHKHQISQDALNELVALQTQADIADCTAANLALGAEMKKLGENGKARIEALEVALAEHLTDAEFEAIRPYADSAAAISVLEKLLARVTNSSRPQPRAADIPMAQRWYPGEQT